MILDSTLNFVGGIPDVVFTQLGKVLRKKSVKDYPVYMKSMECYPCLEDIIKSKSFFSLPSSPPQITVKSKETFEKGQKITYSFPSGYEVQNPTIEGEFNAFERNKTSTIHLWQHHPKKRPPLVLCLHGFMLGDPEVAKNMFRIKNLYGKGVDVALYTLPHHGTRTNRFYKQHLLNPHNIPLTIESFAQAQHDLHATILVLKKLGYDRIGLIGASMGAYTALFYVTLSDLVKFVFTVVPAVKLHNYLAPTKSCFPFPITQEMQKRTFELLDLITPENYSPLIDVAKISVVMHAGDKLNDFRLTKSWAKSWGVSNIMEVPGGHWLYFDKKIRGKTWYRWLANNKFINDSGASPRISS